jgi:hypothetical protein
MTKTPAFNSLSVDFKQNSIDANINEGQAGANGGATSNAKGTKNCN